MKHINLDLLCKILSALLAAILVIFCLFTSIFGASDYIKDISAGSAAMLPLSGVITIGTPEKLYAVAAYINAGYTGAGTTFILTSDIILNDLSDYALWGEGYAPKNRWTPIGNEANAFSGTFDGAGHIISGIYIDAPESYQGLFGCIKGGTVKDVDVTKSYIKGNNYVGGLAGVCKSSTITGCYYNGTVLGSLHVGNLMGTCEDCTVTDCL